MLIKKQSVRKLFSTLALIILMVMLLPACSSTKDNAGELPASSEMPTAVPLPTDTPTPVPGVVVMTYPPEYNTKLLDEARPVLTELAASAGMTFEEYPSLQAGEVKENWKIVVLMNAPANLSELVASAPQTQFVAISSTEQPTAANLSVIVERPENQAFIAGYVTLMIASDWRAGALFADDAISSQQTEAFVNGGHYICGRCTSTWMPIKAFPLLAQMPAATDLATWQSAVTEMKMNVIYVMYVAPEVASFDLLYDLASGGMMLVGGETPPDEVRPVWAGTVRFDSITSLKNLWPALISGQGGQMVDAAIQFTDVNTQYFSQGKGRLAQLAVQDLLEGAIDPLTPPME